MYKIIVIWNKHDKCKHTITVKYNFLQYKHKYSKTIVQKTLNAIQCRECLNVKIHIRPMSNDKSEFL